MAATIEIDCNACGQRHTLFSPVADLFVAGAQYEYVCPQNGESIQFKASDKGGNANVQMCPRDSIVVKQINN